MTNIKRTNGLNAWLEAHQGGYSNYDYGYGYGYGNYGNYGYGGYGGWDDDLDIGKTVIDHTNISNLLEDGDKYYGQYTKDPLDDMNLDDSL